MLRGPGIRLGARPVTDLDVSVFPNRHRGVDSREEDFSSEWNIIRAIILCILRYAISIEKYFNFGGSESLPDGSGPIKSLAARAVTSAKEHVR